MSENYQYSEGELYVQEKVNVVKNAARVSRMVQESADGFAQSFVESQQFGFISTINADGEVWTSLLAGKHIGFAKFENSKQLVFSRTDLHEFDDDILYKNIEENPSVGLLFIDLATRRRQRINGQFYATKESFLLDIEHSFVNCPKYIQLRMLDQTEADLNLDPSFEEGSDTLPQHLKDVISNADTFYMGTAGKNGQLDTSHRGGNSGFVKFAEDSVLKIPDYPGNNMFISLGNIHEHSKTGMLFLDEASLSILQLQGEGSLEFDVFDNEAEQPTGGTGRYWYFKIKKYRFLHNRLPYTWKLAEYSPFNP